MYFWVVPLLFGSSRNFLATAKNLWSYHGMGCGGCRYLSVDTMIFFNK
jgi:hypothetical protein